MVAASVFILAGTTILFAFPAGMPPNGDTAPAMSQLWIGGVPEVLGGGVILLGLFTRPMAFVLSGEMAVAYFQFHFPQSFWPTVNGGIPAISTAFSGCTSPQPAAGPGASTPSWGSAEDENADVHPEVAVKASNRRVTTPCVGAPVL